MSRTGRRKALVLALLAAIVPSWPGVTILERPVRSSRADRSREVRDPMPNAFQGKCADCGATVLAKTGYFDQKLGTFCALHGGIRKLPDPPAGASAPSGQDERPPAPAPPPGRKARIRLVLADERICPSRDKAEIRLTASLSRSDFDSFARACSSVGVQRSDSTRLVNLDLVPRLISIFEAPPHCFPVDVMPELADALYARAGETRESVASAESRTRKFDLELRKRGKALYPYQRHGVERLVQSTSLLLGDDTGLGKSQPDDAGVLTPRGWRAMADLRVGDEVVGSDGNPTEVAGVFPQGEREVWEVVLDDGRSTECDAEHLWAFARTGSRHLTVETLGAMMSRLSRGEPLAVPVLSHGSRGTRRAELVRIASVERAGRKPARCIMVAAADHLYVTDDFIVTHNTIQTLAAVPPGARVLVVAPAIMKGSIVDGRPSGGWAGATAAWRPDYKIAIFHGRASFRWPEPGEVCITNFDILPPTQKELDDEAKKRAKEEKKAAKEAKAAALEPETQEDAEPEQDAKPKRKKKPAEEPKPAPPAPDGVIVIADEAHAFGNPDSKRTQRFRTLTRSQGGVLSKKGKVWALTATPLMNKPGELWSVLDAIGLAQVAFGNWTNFTRLFQATRFQVSKNRWQILWGEPLPEVPTRLAQEMLRRMKKDVLKDLPEKSWKTLVVEIDRATLKLCDETMTQLEAAGLDIEQALDIAESAKDKVAFAAMSKVREALARAKAPMAVELAEQYESAKEPVLFFSAHRVVVDFLAKRKGWGAISGDGGTINIDGEPVKVAKPEVVVRHQRGEIDNVAGTIQAMGAGVDGLQDRISHAVFVDEVWTPGMNAQALGRIERMGQGRKMLITRMIANHALDHRVADVLARKEKLFEETVNAAADRSPDDAKPRFDVATDLERAATRIPPPWRIERRGQ